MRTILILLAALTSLHSNAAINLTYDDSKKLLDSVVWSELGARSEHRLSESDAECMVLSNYDGKVDFDCIIKKDGHEVDLGKRDLENMVYYSDKKLTESGLRMTADRAKMVCFTGTLCKVSNRLSLSDMKHQYCFMTIHSQYGGKLIDESTRQVDIEIESVDCKTTHSRDYLGGLHTLINTTVVVKSGIETTNGGNRYHTSGSLPGHVSHGYACAKINERLKVGELLPARVERKLVESQTTSISNSNKSHIERVHVFFENGMFMNGGVDKTTEVGAFCKGFRRTK